MNFWGSSKPPFAKDEESLTKLRRTRELAFQLQFEYLQAWGVIVCSIRLGNMLQNNTEIRNPRAKLWETVESRKVSSKIFLKDRPMFKFGCNRNLKTSCNGGRAAIVDKAGGWRGPGARPQRGGVAGMWGVI